MVLGSSSLRMWAFMPIKTIEIKSIVDHPYFFRRDLISFYQLVLNRLGIGNHTCGQGITPAFRPPLCQSSHTSFVTSTCDNDRHPGKACQRNREDVRVEVKALNNLHTHPPKKTEKPPRLM